MTIETVMSIMGPVIILINTAVIILTLPGKRGLPFTLSVFALFIAAFVAAISFFIGLVPDYGGLFGFVFLSVVIYLFKGKLFHKVFAFSLQFLIASSISNIALTISDSLIPYGENTAALVLLISLLSMFAVYVALMIKFGRRLFEKLFEYGSQKEWALYSFGAMFSIAAITALHITPGNTATIIMMVVLVLWSFAILCMNILTTNAKIQYKHEATVDTLTQLKNRRDFDLTFQRYLNNYRESDHYLCLAIIDIDFFKNYNDYYGHPKGDECLRAIGGTLNDLQNELDIYAARLGGEEFALLWFEKDRNGINNVISQIQRLIEDLNIPHVKSTVAKRLTVSIGIHITRCGEGNSVQEMYASADNALYEAKVNGRNRAVVFGEKMPDLYRQK